MNVLLALLVAAVVALPLSLMWDAQTALAVGAVLALVLWPLLALSHRLMLWIIQVAGDALTARRGRG